MLFTFPSRYWFTIGRQGVFSLRRWSSQIPAGFHVSRGTQDSIQEGCVVSTTGLSPPVADLSRSFVYETACSLPEVSVQTSDTILQPPICNAHGLTHIGFRLFPFRSPLLWESNFFLFLRVLRCFTSPRSLPQTYIFSKGISRHYPGWVAPFGHPRIKARLAAPRGFSQLTTSFIASWRQGIHHLPLIA